MEKEGPQRLAGCSFHENGHQLLCGLELISIHAIALLGRVTNQPRRDEQVLAAHASQTMAAARYTAPRKLHAVLSYRVAIARYCLRRAKKFSIRCRAL